MAVSTLDATAKGASANSYATQAEATQYQDDRPDNFGTTWSGATSDEKDEALLFATVLMEQLFEWNGAPTTTTQALQWPRTGLITHTFSTVDEDTVPQEIKNAQAEFARQLIATDLSADSDVANYRLSQLKAGSVFLQFGRNVGQKTVPDAVVNLIPKKWIASVRGRGASVGAVPLARA